MALKTAQTFIEHHSIKAQFERDKTQILVERTTLDKICMDGTQITLNDKSTRGSPRKQLKKTNLSR